MVTETPMMSLWRWLRPPHHHIGRVRLTIDSFKCRKRGGVWLDQCKQWWHFYLCFRDRLFGFWNQLKMWFYISAWRRPLPVFLLFTCISSELCWYNILQVRMSLRSESDQGPHVPVVLVLPWITWQCSHALKRACSAAIYVQKQCRLTKQNTLKQMTFVVLMYTLQWRVQSELNNVLLMALNVNTHTVQVLVLLWLYLMTERVTHLQKDFSSECFIHFTVRTWWWLSVSKDHRILVGFYTTFNKVSF